MQSQVNRLLYSYSPAKRDGACNIDNLGSLPNYIPKDQKDEKVIAAGQYEQAAHEQWAGAVSPFDSTVGPKDFV
jgi:catalase